MKKILILLVIVFGVTTFAQQQYYKLGDFKLESGEVIQDAFIGFRTYGKLNENKDNAILYASWFGGNSAELGGLISPDKLLDSTGYFIICTDAFGNGVSSSPSLSSKQPEEQFPIFTIRDMVRSQYQLVTEQFNLRGLFLVMGGSMGSMQVFEWMVTYPDFMKKALPYVPTPILSSSDRLAITTQFEIIELGKKAGLTTREIMKPVQMLVSMIAQTPEFRNQKTTRETFPDFVKGFDREPSKNFSVVNYQRQIQAMLSHDITRHFEYDLQKTAQAIHAKTLMIVAEKDLYVNPGHALTLAPLIKADVLILTNNCGHLAPGCELQRCRETIKKFLEE